MNPTVWSALFDDDRLPAETSKRVRQSEAMAAMYRELRGSGDQTLVQAAANAIEDGLWDALQSPLIDLLMPAWRSHPDYAAALDAARQQQGLVVFGVGEHEVISTQQPRIEVAGASGTLVSFVFVVRLEITLQSAALRIAGDDTLRIAAIGACRSAGILKLEGHEIAATVRDDIQFPDVIAFDRKTEPIETLTAVP